MKGDLVLAIADYDAAVLLNPTGALGIPVPRRRTCRKEGLCQGSRRLQHGIEIQSPRPDISFHPRKCAPAQREPKLALPDFNTAVKLDPADGRSTYGRGLARMLLGDDDGAEEDFQAALELGYNDQDTDC